MAKQRMAKEESAAATTAAAATTTCVGTATTRVGTALAQHCTDAATAHAEAPGDTQLLQEQLRDLQAYKGAYESSEAKCESFRERIVEMEMGIGAQKAKHAHLVQLAREARITFFAAMEALAKGSSDGSDTEQVSWRAVACSLMAVVKPICLYED
jgi:hypothetical protein